MKYWILTTEYPPQFGGGISTYCTHTAAMLSGKKHAVTVFIPDEKIDNYEMTVSGTVRTIRFNPLRTGMQAHLGHVANLAYAFAGITKEIIQQEGKPDCIESQEYLGISYYVLQFKWLRYEEFKGVMVIVTLHSPAFLYLHYNREGVYSFPNYWTGEMEKSCIRGADWIIAPSAYIVEEIKKYTTIDESRVSVIRNPYVRDHIPAVEEKVGDGIIFFGKLSPQKGVFELFQYMRALWDNGFTKTLTVVGGSDKVYYPEMKTMGQIIRSQYKNYIQKGLVHFTGRIRPGQRAEMLQGARVVLIPSMNDNLPYAAIEAMAMGKVILASKQGGQQELINDGINGFLFDHARPETFALKLEYILSLSSEAIMLIGQAARETISAMLNYELIYKEKCNLIEYVRGILPEQHLFPFINPVPLSGERTIVTTGTLLSVVIPYFNMGSFIQECVDSVLASSYTDIEILIINDGSTDKQSLAILQELQKNPVVRVIHKKNEGLADTRNYGAKAATGVYLAFLDADDRIHRGYYEKSISLLSNYENIFFVGSWVQYFGTTNNIWPAWNPELPYILMHNTVNSSALVYKRDYFLKGGLFDKKVDYGIEDYESVVNMLHHGFGGVVLPECLFYYRVRTGSMYRSLTHYKILHSYQYIAQKHADLYSRFASEIYNLLNANGPSFAYDNPSFDMRPGIRNVYLRKLATKIKNGIKKYPLLKQALLNAAKIMKIRQ